MSRRKKAPERLPLPDPLFESVLLAKFINVVMRNGKKLLAQSIVYGALNWVVKKLLSSGKSFDFENEDYEALIQQIGAGDIYSSEAARTIALNAFKMALKNITPTVEVKRRRVGGTTYEIPVEIRSTRRIALAIRWLVGYANRRSEKTTMMCLANEILDALQNRGNAVRKRTEVHSMASANQALVHYR